MLFIFRIRSFVFRGENMHVGEKEQELLVNAILAYPPAIRILNLLSETDEAHLTKFEIGQKLGFIGEDGFTSMPQKIFILVSYSISLIRDC